MFPDAVNQIEWCDANGGEDIGVTEDNPRFPGYPGHVFLFAGWKDALSMVAMASPFRPDTPAEALFPVLPLVDDVLVMTVNPGYGGQRFMDTMMPKMQAIYTHGRRHDLPFDISVDGGIDLHTAPIAAAPAGRASTPARPAPFPRPISSMPGAASAT